MRSYLGLSALFVAAIGSTGCQSPLFHHENADDRPSLPLTDPSSERLATCPIAFTAQDLCASWTWDRVPTDQDVGSAILRFWKKSEGTAAGPYVDPDAQVSVRLWMPSMGHGSSPVTVQASRGVDAQAIPGVFEATQVFFVMPGAWEIWIHLKNDGGAVAQSKLDLAI